MSHVPTHEKIRREPNAHRVTGLSLLLAVSFAVVPITGPAADQGQSIDLEIPAQALIPALNALAERSGLQLLYSAELAEGKRTPGVSGRLTPEEALQALLEGTGVSYRFVDPGTVTLTRPDPLAELVARAGIRPDYAQVTEPAAEKPKAPVEKSDEGPTTLPEMTVTASPFGETSYNVPNATTATKTDTPIMETPLSIQVVPQQVLRDQQVIQLRDAVQNVSGVQFNPSSGNQFDLFVIRGFTDRTALNQKFRNGLRFSSSIGKIDLANIEQVEVLKGPAAVLYGRIEPGGIINLVTKKPLATPYYSLEQEFGSYDFYRTTADATGPLDADRTLLYRFNLGYLNTESFRDFAFQERIFLAPALTWRPREDTEFNLSVEHYEEDQLFDSGIPVTANGPAPIPISRQFTEPGVNDEIDYDLVDFNWSHRFNDNWTFRNGFLAFFERPVIREVSGGSVAEDGRTVNRFILFGSADIDSYPVFADLTGRFQLFGAEHELLLGADYYDRRLEAELFLDLAGAFSSAPIDVFNPVYGQVDLDSLQAQPPDFFTRGGQRWYGVYFQDQITLWDQVHILGGGRYDWATTRSGTSLTSLAAVQEKEIEEEAFSPRVGLVYQPWPWLSLYGNYVESFGANNGRSASGSPLEAQRGKQYEVGFKTEFFDGALTSTLAFYDLTKTNLLAADLSTPDRFDSIAIGEAQSRGIELDMSGQVTDRVSLIATYAYTDTEITKDQGQDEFGNPTPGNQGKRLPGAPRHAGSLWAKYQVLPERFEVGAGVYLVGSRPYNPANSFDVPGYGRADAFAAYHWKLGASRLTAQLNIKNLLDKEYFYATETTFGGQSLYPGEPITVLGSIRVEF